MGRYRKKPRKSTEKRFLWLVRASNLQNENPGLSRSQALRLASIKPSSTGRSKKQPKSNNPLLFEYAERNRTLRIMGFRSYSEYLKSPLWAKIRSAVLHRDNHRCVRCRHEATQVHHQKYDADSMNGSSLSMLHSVCDICHSFAEFDHKGRKLSISQANTRLNLS